MSYSWIPAGGEDGDHLRSSLIGHLRGVGMEGFGIVRCTYQNMLLVARDFGAAGTHLGDDNSCA